MVIGTLILSFSKTILDRITRFCIMVMICHIMCDLLFTTLNISHPVYSFRKYVLKIYILSLNSRHCIYLPNKVFSDYLI